MAHKNIKDYKLWVRGLNTAVLAVSIGLFGLPENGLADDLRDLATDRPDATESPITVDRGHFQLETSFISFSRNDDSGTRTDTLGIFESNLKYGLIHNTDLQLVMTPYVKEVETTAGVKSKKEGASDLQVRVKHNLWGNDEGSTAFGLMPHFKIPTGTSISNDEWEYGLITPFSWDVGERWGIGMQGEINRVFDETDGKNDWELSHTLVVGFELTQQLGAYLEYLGVSGDQPYDSYFSGGFTFALRDQIQLDAGTLVGLNDEAEDLTVFGGFSWKF